MSLLTDLRAKTGASFVECRDALAACDNDILLAQGWLRCHDLAVRIVPLENETREEARKRWEMEEARRWAEQHRQTKDLK
jgi:hypothetical protein